MIPWRHPELERALVGAPDEVEPYLVYADWLGERGDARGELIALSVAAEHDATRELERDRCLGRCVEAWGFAELGEFTWRRGFVDRATVHDEDPLRVQSLLQHPAMRLVRELVFTKAPTEGLDLEDWSRRPQHLRSLEPLAELTNLEVLALTGQRVGDLTPLAALTKLRALGIAETDVKTLTPLLGLGRLEFLGLRYTAVDDIGVVAALPDLRGVNLSATNVTNLEPLWSLAQLTHLNVTRIPLTADGLVRLGGLRRLTHLDLAEAALPSIAPLQHLSELCSLNLNSCQVTDLMPIHGLVGLRYLEAFQVDVALVLHMLASRERALPDAPPLVVSAGGDELARYFEGFLGWLNRERSEDERLAELIA